MGTSQYNKNSNDRIGMPHNIDKFQTYSPCVASGAMATCYYLLTLPAYVPQNHLRNERRRIMIQTTACGLMALPYLTLLSTCMTHVLGGTAVYATIAGFQHDSIPTAIQALQDSLSEAVNIDFDNSEDKGVFTDQGLEGYDVVIFLSTTGEVTPSILAIFNITRTEIGVTVLDTSYRSEIRNTVRSGPLWSNTEQPSETLWY
ncbi:hypothetical protein IW261DRAFT_1416959 [Armillaria novae-zelandiae]|uniref:ThuA-like domain-containing protein n=1 Tax=Armillaria novae-zelandiae TaxID=153914 RepID=A0AA39TF50_9AGAR|nr:hypothetical protein IW261DRAFT_1416959 [Armillaria novae-zelandiae]